MAKINELVINFHMTESCNYRCGYCYATWNEHCSSRELHRHPGRVEQMLEALAGYFFHENPVQRALGYRQVRLNFAGGEPMLLGDRFLQALSAARGLGFQTSIITNGHFLDDRLLEMLASQLSVLGVSCDTLAPAIAAAIGRQDRKGRGLPAHQLAYIAYKYRQLNPTGSFKINTVVNALNHEDSMLPFISLVQPDKWKVLRVLPVHDHQLTLSEAQYRAYLDRHAAVSHLIAEEDNQSMQHSYLMIDPEGRFYQNGAAGAGYQLSAPILETGVAGALAQVAFDPAAFARRYQPIATVNV